MSGVGSAASAAEGRSTNFERDDRVRAWTSFWEEQGPTSRCLEKASPEIHESLSEHWTSLASTLPQAARVLDIGCGGGAVARSLSKARSEQVIVGIDLALIPRGNRPEVQTLSGVAAESLPFPRASFDAAVSQFGFEYTDVPLAAAELARVLRPGGILSLIVHHADSAVVRAERIHNDALKALKHHVVMSSFVSGDAAALGRNLRSLELRFPNDKTIKVAAAGLLKNIFKSHRQRIAIWNAVMEAIEPDHTLSRALLSSCVGTSQLGEWLRPIRSGFELRAPAVFGIAEEPVGWKITGSRKH